MLGRETEAVYWEHLVRNRLGLHPTPHQRRLLADILRAQADYLDRIAGAEEREVLRGVRGRATRRYQGRHPGDFVRVAEEAAGGALRYRIYIGRLLWYALGRPARIDIQRVGGAIRIAPAEADAGWKLATETGMPRAFVDSAYDLIRLDAGRYAATVEGTILTIGERRGD